MGHKFLVRYCREYLYSMFCLNFRSLHNNLFVTYVQCYWKWIYHVQFLKRQKLQRLHVHYLLKKQFSSFRTCKWDLIPDVSVTDCNGGHLEKNICQPFQTPFWWYTMHFWGKELLDAVVLIHPSSGSDNMIQPSPNKQNRSTQ